jgi:transcriptional regulator with XRE-family HTH domain
MQTPWADDIGQVARQRRLDLDLSQDDLAERAGVTRQWLTKFESAKSDVSLSKVLRVLRELDLILDISPKPEPLASADEHAARMSAYPFIDPAVMDRMNDHLRRALGDSFSEPARAAAEALTSDPRFRESMLRLQESNLETLAKVAAPIAAFLAKPDRTAGRES